LNRQARRRARSSFHSAERGRRWRPIELRSCWHRTRPSTSSWISRSTPVVLSSGEHAVRKTRTFAFVSKTSITAQGGIERSPLDVDPTTDRDDNCDHRDEDDAEQNSVLDEGGAVFVIGKFL